jgi:conjugative relaxase-like TrwC/TraI family protein
MLNISKAISSKQAKKYYQTEFQEDKNISLSNSPADVSLDTESLERTSGKWYGKLAEEMNLRGAVTTEQFERLCDGLHPFTEEELVRHAPVKHYANRFGKEITTMEHRALWDGTFSAPKSVSLATVAGGDDRIRQAHRESVRLALNEVEKYIEARMGGGKLSERTGKMIAAVFEHDTARPDKVFKIAAPQLHTHVGIFNVSETEAGITKPIQPMEIFKSQKYATAVYRIELADRLQKLGYEIEIDPRTKAPEIKGISSEYLKESSPRSQEIQKDTEAIKSRFELEGVEVKNDVGIRQVAAWQQRESKAFDPEEMKTRALELEVKYDFQAQKTYGQALQNIYQYDAAAERQRAKEAIDFAKQIASPSAGLNQDLAQTSLSVSGPEASAKLTERRFLTEALEKGIGTTHFAAVQQEYFTRSAAGEFANLIKNENESSSSRKLDVESAKEKGQKSGKATGEQQISKSSSEELKSAKEVEKLSMDDLENAVRQKIIVEKESAQSFELLLGI